jgi:two-component system, NtrC family, sensor kinase
MSETVLIVDDSLTVRMDLVEAFEAAGFHVRPCAALEEARHALKQESVSVIVLDVMLPDGDGLEFLREMRTSRIAPDAKVLMLSTEADVKHRIRGLEAGADEYVGKPYDRSYVVAKARELAGKRIVGAEGQTTILIIDDSVTFREELREAFEAAGYAVLTAVTGEEGLHIAADERPAAIVVDGVLPGIDGPTVIRRIRLDAALRGVPCLLLTAAEDNEAELRALDAGADAFVRKEEDVDVILARLAAVLRRTAAPSGEKSISLLSPKKILAVDDSLTYLQELAATLREEGYDVALARSGDEAIELLAVQPMDCILLDLVMPGLSGQETCRRIKSAPVLREIPLIMLTAHEDRAAMLDGLGAGADDFIQKSSEFEVLKARVRAQIRRKQFEDENRRIREELLRAEIEAAEARAAQALAATRAVLLKELERKNKELESFSYSVSHDLRTPLRSIDGFSQALLDNYADKLDTRGEEYLRRVRAAAQRMGHLMDALLELSRIGMSDLRHDKIDLSNLAKGIVSELRARDPERKVEVQVQEGLRAEADERLMQIVLENLFSNAWKFTSKAQNARIEFGKMDSPSGEMYFVRDNGAGFNLAFADKLFGAFQRMHRQEEFPGNGVGLATVQRIIQRHGGKVSAESECGVGSTFYFTL